MSERTVTLAVGVVVVVFVWHHPWVLGTALALWLARRALGWFAGWARRQRLLREGLVARCVSQNADVARGDVSGIYGAYPPF